jgi:hypothetical protein
MLRICIEVWDDQDPANYRRGAWSVQPISGFVKGRKYVFFFLSFNCLTFAEVIHFQLGLSNSAAPPVERFEHRQCNAKYECEEMKPFPSPAKGLSKSSCLYPSIGFSSSFIIAPFGRTKDLYPRSRFGFVLPYLACWSWKTYVNNPPLLLSEPLFPSPFFTSSLQQHRLLKSKLH